jgi:NAD-dependent SIR2 family protein deacetylase
MTDPEIERLIAPVADIIKTSNVVVLSGAGISTASGIPDYRDQDGVRRGRAPMMFQEFISSEAARKRYWARSLRGWLAVRAALPNSAHAALASLQDEGRVSGLITQNVDNLHTRAGSHDVVDLHGNLHRVRCLDCGAQIPRDDIQLILEASNAYLHDVDVVLAPDGDALVADEYLDGFTLPHCLHCDGERLKPDVVFFGENVTKVDAERAMQKVGQADGLLVVGSSLMAFSAFRLCQAVNKAGKPIAAINIGRTRGDEIITVKVEVAAERALPLLRSMLR